MCVCILYSKYLKLGVSNEIKSMLLPNETCPCLSDINIRMCGKDRSYLLYTCIQMTWNIVVLFLLISENTDGESALKLTGYGASLLHTQTQRARALTLNSRYLR